MSTRAGKAGPDIEETGTQDRTTSSIFRLGLDRMIPCSPETGGSELGNTERWRRLAQVKRRLIVVDDEERMCELLAIYFEAKGLEVVTATTTSEALELIEEGGYALMILDWKLGGTDGKELLNLSKAAYPSVPVVIFTGTEDRGLLKQAFVGRADAIVRKIGPLDALAAEVRVHLDPASES